MDTPLRLLFPADVYPPTGKGGAAWSTRALAQALAASGHQVTVVVPMRGAEGLTRREDGPVEVVEVGYRAPNIPFVQNVARFELLWQKLASVLVELGRRGGAGPLLIHGHHAQTIPAAVLAARSLGVPAVGTIRDYWPIHYFATGLLGDRLPRRSFGPAEAALDLLLRRKGLAGATSLLALPYVLRHTRRRGALLAQADAVICNSSAVAEHLAPIIPQQKLHVIPTPVDLEDLDRCAAERPHLPLDDPYVLFAGKLERNKGAALLPEVVRAAVQAGATGWTLAVAGRGPLRRRLEHELAELPISVRWLDWVDHDEVLRLSAHCAALIFPSLWEEPLSRVLVEAAALGTPIAAMPTGGTPDIIENEATGLLASMPGQLGRSLARLLGEPGLAARLGAALRTVARQRSAAPAIAASHEALYARLLAR